MADRLIGYNTLGSIDYIQNQRLYITNGVALNRYITPVSIKNPCFGVIYVDASEEWGTICRPVIFADNNNFPGNKISKNEQSYNCRLNTSYLKGKYWLSADFELEQPIPANTPIWFGFFSEHFPPRMDTDDTDYYIGYPANNAALNTPTVFPANYKKNYLGKFKFSHYFYATIAQQNLKITITQTAAIHHGQNRYGSFYRKAREDVRGTTAIRRFAAFPRKCLVTLKTTMTINAWPTLIRRVTEQVRAATGLFEKRGLARNVIENVAANITTKRFQGFYRKAQEGVTNTDDFSSPVLFLRSLPETVTAVESVKRWGAYIRGLPVEAASMAETSRGGAYYRTQTETVKTHGSVFRGLLIFVKIFTTSFVRDFLIRRFLKSKENLVLKSCVCREIFLESKIN